ncbi:MAG: ABC transporter permease [Anaerolineales bacterium]|jgi:simple sugar transport system permease protein
MAEAALEKTSGRTTRQIAIGIFMIVIGLLVFLMLTSVYREEGGLALKSTLVLESQRAGVSIPAPDLVLPTFWTLAVLTLVVAGLAGWQLWKGFTRTTWVIAGVAGILIMGFLIWATRDRSINLTGMLVSSLIRATPIALAALSGLYSERSGVVNIAIEGMMLGGAFTSVVIASVSGNLWLGVLAGILTGMVFALLHGVLSIRYMVDQIISGTGIIILALGLTSFLQRAVLNLNPELNRPGPAMAALPIPGLWKIPVLGPVLFNLSPIIYIMFALLIITRILMNNTRWGLRTRSVGEHPKAADTLGINVFRTRYVAVLISGAIAGLAGAYMSIGSAGRFNEGMTAGKGFLGLAAMIFGNWNPGGAFVGSLIFGFFDSWQEKLALLQTGVAGELLGMAPYLATMVVLAGFIGRSRMPAADGQPYEKQ